MKPYPPLLVLAVMIAVVLGVPLGLYALLTRGRRGLMRTLHAAASERGWEFRRQRWQGDPTAFRINGWSGSTAWILKSGPGSDSARGWSVRLGLRFPSLGGEMDFALAPRDSGGLGISALASRLSPGARSRMAALSGAGASAAEFFRDARGLPARLPAFDAAYQVWVRPAQSPHPHIDRALAERVVHWSADAIAPHSMLAWRDPFGFHIEARLPATPNWPTISYFLSLAEDLALRLPAPTATSAPSGFVDKFATRFLEP